MRIIKPKRLKKGDLIGLVAPASTPSAEEKIDRSILYLERMGYNVRPGKHIRDERGYLAGTDVDRAADFNDMIRDGKVKAVFSLRGGYGTPRILGLIDYRAIAANPKIIVGYSDITALQLAIFKKTGLVTFSGPMPAVDMWKGMEPYTEELFWRMLTSVKKIGELENPQDEPVRIVRHGKTKGKILGGNLSLLVSLLGTKYQPVLNESVLVLEDVDEEPHRIDRMLAQLLNAGCLGRLNGLIFGKFTDCVPSSTSDPFLTVEQVQEDYAVKMKCPVVSNFGYGHIPRKLTIPLGLEVLVDTKKEKIEIAGAGVS